MSYYNPNIIHTSTSLAPTQHVVCYACRIEFYNVLPGWEFERYTIKCPHCGVAIGVDDK